LLGTIDSEFNQFTSTTLIKRELGLTLIQLMQYKQNKIKLIREVMTEKYTQLKNRIIHYYDIEMYNNQSNESFHKEIINGGIYINNDKLVQSKKFNKELNVVEVFQQQSIVNTPDYFLEVFSPMDKLKMILIEEL
jgi:hypothetical protein